MVMSKLDLKTAFKPLYRPSAKTVSEADVPALWYLMVDGSGDPNTAVAYKDAIGALYSVAYTLKFASKNAPAGIDFTVMPLEGLWWLEEMGEAYGDFDFAADKNLWQWTAMIVQPDHITPTMVVEAIADVRRKKNPPALDKVRFEAFHEGRAAQIMHIGPYSDEKPNIDRLHAYIDAQGCEPCGKHHEIYLSDPGRTAPEKLKTIIRWPMRPRVT